MAPVLGPHTRTDRTRDTRVAEPWLPAPEDGRPGEGQRLTPGAPHNGGGPPPPGTAPQHPRGTWSPQGMQAKGTVLGPHVHTPAPTARGWRTTTARPMDGQLGEGQRLTSDAPHHGGRRPPSGTLFRHPHSEQRGPAGAHAVGPVLGPHARTDRARDTWVTEPRLPAPKDGRSGEGQRLSPDAPRNAGKRPPPGTPIRRPHNEQRTNAPAHQPRDICTPPPALRHSDTTMAEPAAPRKTRPRSPTLDEAHEVIRALGLRDGEGDPPQGDAGTDSDLETVPELPTGSAPAEPALPAGSVPALCPAWKRAKAGAPNSNPSPAPMTERCPR